MDYANIGCNNLLRSNEISGRDGSLFDYMGSEHRHDECYAYDLRAVLKFVGSLERFSWIS